MVSQKFAFHTYTSVIILLSLTFKDSLYGMLRCVPDTFILEQETTEQCP